MFRGNLIIFFYFSEWGHSENPAYALSNENKTATRTSKGLTHVLYSNTASFIPGNILTIKVLDGADKSPGDGLCVCLRNNDNDHFGQGGVVYVNLYGKLRATSFSVILNLNQTSSNAGRKKIKCRLLITNSLFILLLFHPTYFYKINISFFIITIYYLY